MTEIISILLNYAVDILLFSKYDRLPEILVDNVPTSVLRSTVPPESPYHTMLLNDESHTFDVVCVKMSICVHEFVGDKST